MRVQGLWYALSTLVVPLSAIYLLSAGLAVVACPLCVEPESIHVAPILLERISPEVEVGLPGVGDGVNPARRSTFRGLPLRLDDAVLLHLPQGPVQGARVHSFKAKSSGPFHELVAVGVPLPQRQQD